MEQVSQLDTFKQLYDEFFILSQFSPLFIILLSLKNTTLDFTKNYFDMILAHLSARMRELNNSKPFPCSRNLR